MRSRARSSKLERHDPGDGDRVDLRPKTTANRRLSIGEAGMSNHGNLRLWYVLIFLSFGFLLPAEAEPSWKLARA